MICGKSADKSLAYILGVYLGDGCVTRTRDGYPAFRLNTIDMDFADATKAAISDLSEYGVSIHTHPVSKSSKPNHALRCGDPALCKRLVEETCGKQSLPAWIYDAPIEDRRAFVVGLMDSEGFVAAKTHTHTGRRYYMGYKSCDVWVPDFMRVLQSVGIKYGKIGREKPRKPGYKTPTRFTIKMQSWVDSGCRFNIARKQDRVDIWAKTVPYSERSRYPARLISEANTPDAPLVA